MSDGLTVGVIGAGVVGEMRVRTVVAEPRTTLWGVAEPDAEQRARVAAKTGARVVTEHAAIIEAPEVDAVIVSTPAPLHEAMVTAALAAGKHVLCEKPLGTTVESCTRMVAAAKQADRVLAVGFNHRYYPSFRFVRRMIDDGRLGAIDYVRVNAGHPGLGEFRADWMYESDKSGGGAMMDIGIHLTDLVRYFVGDIARVYGRTTERVWRVAGSEDNAMALLETAGGVSVLYQASWTEWKGYRMCVDVYGQQGTVRGYYAPMFNVLATRSADGSRTRSFELYPWLNVREKLGGWERTAGDAFAMELHEFLERIAGRPSSMADGVAGLRAVEIAHAVYESSRRGEPVSVPRCSDAPMTR